MKKIKKTVEYSYNVINSFSKTCIILYEPNQPIQNTKEWICMCEICIQKAHVRLFKFELLIHGNNLRINVKSKYTDTNRFDHTK